MEKIPVELFTNISFFLGSDEHKKLTLILNKEKMNKLNDLISNIIISNSVTYNSKNMNALIEINPRRKISHIIEESMIKKLVIKDFLEKNNYYTLWITNKKKV